MDALHRVPLRQIDADPRFQVRLQWDPATDDHLASLAASLAGPEGLIHPIVVVRLLEPTTFGRCYALIAGHRRLAAARQLGWETILARVLPPCDLTLSQHQLPLLAMAVRENTEREDLPRAERQAAVRRLEALYLTVYPEAAMPRPGPRAPDTPEPFPQWAERVTTIPAHTIRRDLRGRLLAGEFSLAVPAASEAPEASSPVPDLPDAPADPVQGTVQTTQQAVTALQTLAAALPTEARRMLSEAQYAVLHQQLSTLQTTLSSLWPLLRRPSEHPLVPFALAAQEHLAALRGTLWGLKTGTPEAWQTLPSPVLRTLRSAMAAVLADWEAVTATLPGVSPDASAATPRAPTRPVAQA